MNSRNAGRAPETRIHLSITRFTPAAWLARKMIGGWWAQLSVPIQSSKLNKN